jgi:hypothetical protein
MLRSLTISLCAGLAVLAHGQTEAVMPGAPQVVAAKLPPASYPPIALAAHISGGVTLDIVLRRDGSLVSAVAVSGPPMLREPGEILAGKTTFACEGCTADATKFEVTYRFELGPSLNCDETKDPAYPTITSSDRTIVISDRPMMICDPAFEVSRTRARSARCLFLWKCGWREEQ